MRLPLIGLTWMALALSAVPGRALDVAEARHLLLRTGLGTPPAETEALGPLDRAAAVARLLAGTATVAVTPPPAWVHATPDWQAYWRTDNEPMKQAFVQDRDFEAAELKAWWYAELIATPSPLTERLVLMWHNHFTSSYDKVRAPDLLYRQNALFRRHALGNYRTLLRGVARDPAMLRYLDGTSNSKAKPNENFARELFELFTLGPGEYTERDIKEAARAFSGWRVDSTTGQFAYAHREHDEEDKTILGRTGNFTGDDVIDLVLDRPAAARHAVARLWREFVSETPDPAELDRLAALFRTANFELRPLLAALLQSPAFWAEAHRGILVKSPVELMVGTIRTFGLAAPDTRPLVEFGRRLRQDLFNPPNVKGWPGGATWISSVTLLARRDFLERLARGRDILRPTEAASSMTMMMAGPAGVPATPSPGLSGWLDARADATGRDDRLAALLVAAGPVDPAAASGTPLDRLERLLLDPAYQMK